MSFNAWMAWRETKCLSFLRHRFSIMRRRESRGGIAFWLVFCTIRRNAKEWARLILFSRRALFVCDRRAWAAGQMHRRAFFEAHFGSSFRDVGAREIERIAELDQHVQRHEQAK